MAVAIKQIYQAFVNEKQVPTALAAKNSPAKGKLDPGGMNFNSTEQFFGLLIAARFLIG